MAAAEGLRNQMADIKAKLREQGAAAQDHQEERASSTTSSRTKEKSEKGFFASLLASAFSFFSGRGKLFWLGLALVLVALVFAARWAIKRRRKAKGQKPPSSNAAGAKLPTAPAQTSKPATTSHRAPPTIDEPKDPHFSAFTR